MTPDIFLTLANLGIGGVAIGGLIYISNQFLIHLDKRAEKHELSMAERENSLRIVEKEVRTTVLLQLTKNTEVMNDTTRTLERVVSMLDKR